MKLPAVILSGVLLVAFSPALAASADDELASLVSVQPGETVVIPELKGVLLLAQPLASGETTPATRGVDAGRIPLLANKAFTAALAPFLGRPASVPSLDRLQHVIRVHLQILGRPFANIWIPPQDVTDGTVRIVVQLASLDGDVRVAGNKWFARERYAGGLRARGGEAFDTAMLNADLAWLNRNPFSRVTPVVEAGERPGTTRVTLRADEEFPLTLNVGYSNTGTENTGEDRLSAGLQWGNAFGRGDLVNLGASGDPSWDHMRSYNVGYIAFLPWRHVLSLQGAYSTIASVMPEPFTQSGVSWQMGARYEIPLAAPRPGWTQSLSLSADFKYSDNTLEFAEIPVTGNVTHIAQIGASYGVTFPAAGGSNDARVEAVISPGGLSNDNDDAAFAGSRPGAQATYGYLKIGLRHQRALPGGFSLSLSGDTQFSSGELIGSEQLNGGGSSAVRGYRESSAFGDWGIVGSAELHAPAFAVFRGRDRADAFAFLDAASLRQHGDEDHTGLASAGLGVNYQFGRYLSLRGAYGWQLNAIASSRGVYSGHGHVSANLAW